MEERNQSDRAKRDLELVNQALAGDQRAFTKLMSVYKDNIYFLMLKMVNSKDDADDLTIEAFGKAFKRLNQYSPEYAFSTWLFKIASNNGIDFLRRRKKARTISMDEGFLGGEDEDDNRMDFDAEVLDPEQNLMRGQRIEEMHRIVEQLKPKYRQLVDMRYFQEMSYEEVAEQLGLPLGTVKAQLFRARELMYEILKHSINRI